MTGQARQQVTELRQLHLQAPLAGARASRKDIQNELRAIEHLDAQLVLEISLLRGSEIVVE